MAKQTKTEYEEAERTVTKIQCDECEEKWEERGEDGHNLIVLNVTIQDESTRSRWRDRGFDPTFYSREYYRMNGDDSIDLCDSCLDGVLPGDAMMEVEEPDYYVDEKEVVEYMCDFCDESMGESTDHTVTVNPRMVRVEKLSGSNMRETDTKVLTQSLRSKVRVQFHVTDNYSATSKHGGQFDCCDSCAGGLFGRKEKFTSDNSSSGGFLTRFFGM